MTRAASGRGANQYARGSRSRLAASRPAALGLAAQVAGPGVPASRPAPYRAQAVAQLSTFDRAIMAGDVLTPAALLREIASSPESEVQRTLMMNQRCPADVLYRFRNSEWEPWNHVNATPSFINWAIRSGRAKPETAAQHRNLNGAGMMMLARWAVSAHDGDSPGDSVDRAEYRTEYHLASRLDLDERAMRLLARRGGQSCRYMLADHKFAPPDVLEILLQDTDRQVPEIAARNPNLPRHLQAMWQLVHDRSLS